MIPSAAKGTLLVESNMGAVKVVRAFISASFDPSADKIVEWFCDMAQGVGIDTVWLKDEYEARPTRVKIIEHIRECISFVQIITTDIKKSGKEAGWLGNEIAWAYDATPKDHMAVFVEEGMKASGLAREILWPVPYRMHGYVNS
jgi:hypothetical protein